MVCSVDHGKYPLREYGYLPLILPGGGDGLVIVQGYSANEVKALKPGREVLCTREPGKGKPIVVTPTVSNNSYPGISEMWADEMQFDACLFRIWGDGELALHFGIRRVKNRPLYREKIGVDLSDPDSAPRETLNRVMTVEQLAGGDVFKHTNGDGHKKNGTH
jgi:hypothetical protein